MRQRGYKRKTTNKEDSSLKELRKERVQTEVDGAVEKKDKILKHKR